MKIALDFSGLDSIATRNPQNDHTEPLRGEGVQTTTEATETEIGAIPEPERAYMEAPDEVAIARLQREQEDHEKIKRMYGEYQTNIRRAGQLRSDIIRGVRAGEDPIEILLKAVECISIMTGDKQYYTQTRQDVKAIWGEGFLDRVPLEWELSEIQGRLKNMLDALDRTGDTATRRRIQGAIEAHRKREKEINGLIEISKTAMRAGA